MLKHILTHFPVSFLFGLKFKLPMEEVEFAEPNVLWKVCYITSYLLAGLTLAKLVVYLKATCGNQGGSLKIFILATD